MSKTQKNQKFRLNPIAAVALVLCALVAIYCATTAWITSGTPVNPLKLLKLQDFDYVAEYNVGDGWNEIENGSTDLSVSNIADLENLQLRIYQKGSGVAFARLRIMHEWKAVNENGEVVRFQSEQNLPFIINESDFYDNRNVDGYIYRKGDFEEDITYTIVNGFDINAFDSSVISSQSDITLTLNVSIDAVQFNRYRQIWGIDSLPWRN